VSVSLLEAIGAETIAGMTLVTAGVEHDKIWMIGDTKLTDVLAGVRETLSDIKIIRRPKSLIGYAGIRETARAALEHAFDAPEGDDTIRILRQHALASEERVEFCYAFFRSDGPYLYKISPEPKRFQRLYLGNAPAYGRFSKILNGKGFAAQRNTSHDLHMFTEPDEGEQPDCLFNMIVGMLSTLSYRGDGSVGGWVSPFYLTNKGSSALQYYYNIMIMDRQKLSRDRRVIHGTAEAGGLTVVLTSTKEPYSVCVYCKQNLNGWVFVQEKGRYQSYNFKGSNSEFREYVRSLIGKTFAVMASEDFKSSAGELRTPFYTEEGKTNITMVLDQYGHGSVEYLGRPTTKSFMARVTGPEQNVVLDDDTSST